MADAELEGKVREALRKVRYPDVAKDVVATGLVKKIAVAGDAVTVGIDLPTMVSMGETQAAFEKDVLDAVRGVPGVGSARADVQVKVVSLPPPMDKNRAPGIKNVIAVAAGKGGVGKSTVAVNLALALRRFGAQVGMLDADIYGPSVPTMLGTPEQPVGGTPDKKISPAIYYGMKVISVGFFLQRPDDAVVWRGPMIHKLLAQFMEDVDWGPLDYLVMDLPPGTGDVQLSLSQLVPVTGALMVTTPQEVAVIDVVKAISMFKKVEIPVMGVVENMAYYRCPACGHHDDIFASGGGKRLSEHAGVPLMAEIPIDAAVRHGGDSGTPVVIGAPESPNAKIFMDLAVKVAGRLVTHVLAGPRRSPSLVTVR
jgi:ATP-binding protein involved in chromosome partitioning